ncbi:hypothetical protein [Rubritalea tangerina]
MYSDLLFTDRGLEMVSGAQPRSAVGCSVLFCKVNFWCASQTAESCLKPS